MMSHAQHQLELLNERRSREIAEAALARQVPRRTHPIGGSIRQLIARIGGRIGGDMGHVVGRRNNGGRTPNIGRSPDVAADL